MADSDILFAAKLHRAAERLIKEMGSSDRTRLEKLLELSKRGKSSGLAYNSKKTS
jgi:hypothetical protein